jgi:hypothetical protein
MQAAGAYSAHPWAAAVTVNGILKMAGWSDGFGRVVDEWGKSREQDSWIARYAVYAYRCNSDNENQWLYQGSGASQALTFRRGTGGSRTIRRLIVQRRAAGVMSYGRIDKQQAGLGRTAETNQRYQQQHESDYAKAGRQHFIKIAFLMISRQGHLYTSDLTGHIHSAPWKVYVQNGSLI